MASAAGGRVAWFRRAKEPELERPIVLRDDEPPDSTDTVGNPIIERRRGRHVAEEPAKEAPPLPSRAEHRVLQMVAEGRVARTTTGGAAAAFWRVDGAFATGTRAMMLDWLLEQHYIELGRQGRVAADAVLTAPGREVLLLHG